MRVYQLVSWIIALSKQFTEEKLAQIAGAAMAAIEEAWQSMGHTKRELEDACERLVKAGGLENWAGKKHVSLD
jgi:predicted ArsR family transcriptional regulator